MPSFDIVSRLDLAEVDNAIAGIAREIATRFDFKGAKSSVTREDGSLLVLADDDLKRLQELTLRLVADNPHLRDKSMVCPHFPQPWVRDLRIGEPEAWLAFAQEPAILDLIESLK